MQNPLGFGVLRNSPGAGTLGVQNLDVKFFDQFTGSVGALTSHAPNVGSSWSAQASAGYNLTGSGAVECLDAGSSSIGVVLALASSAYPQNVTISCTIVNTGGGMSGLVFNYTDANTYWFLDASAAIIYQVAGGTPTARITGSVNLSATHKIVLTATTVKYYINGVQQGTTYTRTQPADTKIGTYCDSSEAGGGGTWDNFTISA